ncbi:unnamed protein product [Ectocarpus sp. 4 AP-2014]
MESITRMLSVISEDQQKVLRRTRTISSNVGARFGRAARSPTPSRSDVYRSRACGDGRHENASHVLGPSRGAAKTSATKAVVCRHEKMCPRVGVGDLRKGWCGLPYAQPKEWMRKHAMLLRVSVMAILAASAVVGNAASGGAMGPIASSLMLPFEVIDLDEAYSFLSGVEGEAMDRMLDDVSDVLDPTKGEAGAPTNLERVKEVTGAEYRSVLNFLDTWCQGWDRQMGGMERAFSVDGVMGWVYPQHRSEWKASNVKGTSATARRASSSARSPVSSMTAKPSAASRCSCVIK